MIISIVEIFKLIKPYSIGDKVFYINPGGLIRRATITDIKIGYNNDRHKIQMSLKVFGVSPIVIVDLWRNSPRRLYSTRETAKRYAPEVIKYFQEN